MPADPIFLIVVFDGLRPDMITPDIAPNLSRFKLQGCDFPASRAVFPTMTRVNVTALATGSVTGTHGIVANNFYDPRVFSGDLVHGNKFREIEAGQAAYGGRLVTAPSLGEVLAEGGLSLAIVSTGTGGSARLLNPRARELSQVSLCLREWEASTPPDYAADLLKSFGPIPPAGRPNSARLSVQTDLFLEKVFPQFRPNISILWYSDPDSTCHYCGIGSSETKRAIRHADGEFGRILDWWQGGEFQEQLQIIVLSDHGHLTARRKVSINDELSGAGFRFNSQIGNGADFVGSLAYTGAVWVRDGDRRLMARLVDWLFEQPWCGMIFTPGADGVEGSIPGTFNRSIVMADHERAPEIYYIMRNDNSVDENGIVGGCYFSDSYPEGGSVHGGLHLQELNNVFMARGSFFKEGYRSDYPAGIIDVAPTVMHLLGLPRPPSMNGRVLGEAIAGPDRDAPKIDKLDYSVGTTPRRQRLQASRIGSTLYCDGGWVE